MEKRYNLFFQTITKLSQAGILSKLILIGSWCLFFYRIKFNDAEQIPALRTLDIDFLISNPPKISKKVNIPDILLELGFIEEFSPISNNSKFIHPDLEIEFLIPEKGRGKDGSHSIKEINITAQGLRYVGLLQDHTIVILYNGIEITVPEPSAFVLHKLQLSSKRNKPDKKLKDLETAVGLGEFLISIPDEADKIKMIFNTLPDKWKKEILFIAEENSNDIYAVLKC